MILLTSLVKQKYVLKENEFLSDVNDEYDDTIGI